MAAATAVVVAAAQATWLRQQLWQLQATTAATAVTAETAVATAATAMATVVAATGNVLGKQWRLLQQQLLQLLWVNAVATAAAW